jgi:uncharacterized protein
MRTVVEAAALYPAPIENPGRQFSDSRLYQAFERIGVGALPFLPGATEEVRTWLRGALSRGGWSLADRAIPQAIRERADELRLRVNDPVLIGVLRDTNPTEHLTWIVQQRMYYAPALKDARRQFAATGVAIYSPTALRKPGALTHFGKVERAELIQRGEISTPWPARDADALYVLYSLAEIETLQPIENRAPYTRVSTNRWTSMLALSRARTLSELLLELEGEWHLYEDLMANGIQFSIYAAKGHTRAAGRAIFRTEFGSILFRGHEGFQLISADQRTLVFPNSEDVLRHLLTLR